MNVKDVMTRSPKACAAGDSANDAARIMWEQDCGSVPVVDHAGCVVGMVTDRDICMAAYFQGAPLSSIPLSNIMSRDVCTCEAGTELNEAERMMQDWRVRRLPVVDEGGSLVGMLSLGDVAQGVRPVRRPSPAQHRRPGAAADGRRGQRAAPEQPLMARRSARPRRAYGLR